MGQVGRSEDQLSARELLEAEAFEIKRQAEAKADLVRSDADRYAHERRVAAERLHEQARRQLVVAEEEALARRSAAERQAQAIIQQAEQRARQESDALLNHARRRLADVVEQNRPARKLPLLGRQKLPDADTETTAPVIDLRSRTTLLKPQPQKSLGLRPPGGPDPLDEIVEEAVSKAVRRTFRPTDVRAGRYG